MHVTQPSISDTNFKFIATSPHLQTRLRQIQYRLHGCGAHRLPRDDHLFLEESTHSDHLITFLNNAKTAQGRTIFNSQDIHRLAQILGKRAYLVSHHDLSHDGHSPLPQHTQSPRPSIQLPRQSIGEARERWLNFFSHAATCILLGLLCCDTVLIPLHWLHWVSLSVIPIEVAAGICLLEPLGRQKFLSCLPIHEKNGITILTFLSMSATTVGTLIDAIVNPSPTGCNLGLVSAAIFCAVTCLRLGWVIRETWEAYQTEQALTRALAVCRLKQQQHPLEHSTSNQGMSQQWNPSHVQRLEQARVLAHQEYLAARKRLIATSIFVACVTVGLVIPHILAASATIIITMKVALTFGSLVSTWLTRQALDHAKRRTEQAGLEMLSQRERHPSPRDAAGSTSPHSTRSLPCLSLARTERVREGGDYTC